MSRSRARIEIVEEPPAPRRWATPSSARRSEGSSTRGPMRGRASRSRWRRSSPTWRTWRSVGDLQRERYRKAFGEAIRGAVLALEREERRILRRHFSDGVTLDGLAEELGVHRATVARRLAAARTALRRDARRRLRAALGTTESEIESLAAELRSQLDLSLPSLLASE